jgi:hypothetical protein
MSTPLRPWQVGTPRGGSAAWGDPGPGGVLLRNAFFGVPAAAGAGGMIKVWMGSAFEWKPIKWWDGAAFVVGKLKYWTGTVWQLTGGDEIPSGGTQVRFGNETLPPFDDVDLNGEDGRIFLTRFLVPSSGTLDFISIYSNSVSSAGLVKGVCYADNAGVPGALIAVGAEVNTSAPGAYYQSACAGEALTGGEYVWIGAVHKDFHSVMRANNSSGTGWAQFGNSNYAAPEDPLLSGFAIGYDIGVFAEYTTP